MSNPAPATPSWYAGQRPLTLAILAMGGEGGGVLADWIVALAERAGHRAQSTSVAGVAQRTGATVYYVELFPPAGPGDGPPAEGPAEGRAEPVLSLFPSPGEVDVVIASELMEAGRAVQRGFSTPDRTTLIASTHRVYAIDEKMAPGDGRVDNTALLDAAGRGSKRLIAADFARIAEESRSVISAALFGALAGSGVLPFGRERFERQIREFGKGVEPSLRAFHAGCAAAAELARPAQRPVVDISIGPRPRTPEEQKAEEETRRNRIAADDPAALVGPDLRPLAERVRDLPGASRSMALHGLVRTALYQDVAYAERYLGRVARFAALEPGPDGSATLTTEAARHIALWMCYQDTIQVAQQKVRFARTTRIREEAGAAPDQLVQVREFLHPRVDEITDTLPARLGAALRRSRTFRRAVAAATRKGMILNTSSIIGYTMLATMARVRPLRPRSLRFGHEQAAIDAWLDLAADLAAGGDPDLACEVLRCQNVLKGYGATYEHGNESFTELMRAARALPGTSGAAEALAGLRSAAVADEDGATLRARLAEAGL